MGVQRQGSVFHIAAGVKKYGVPKIERPTCSTHRTLCPIVLYAPMVFVKVTPLMSKESGLSIMGDCQCSYTGSHPVQEAWGSQDSLYGCRLIFRRIISPKKIIPKGFYSEGSFFSKSFIPKGHYSKDFSSRRVVILKFGINLWDKNLQNNDPLG